MPGKLTLRATPPARQKSCPLAKLPFWPLLQVLGPLPLLPKSPSLVLSPPPVRFLPPAPLTPTRLINPPAPLKNPHRLLKTLPNPVLPTILPPAVLATARLLYLVVPPKIHYLDLTCFHSYQISLFSVSSPLRFFDFILPLMYQPSHPFFRSRIHT